MQSISRTLIEYLLCPQDWEALWDLIEAKYYPERFELKDVIPALLRSCTTDSVRYQVLKFDLQ